MSVREITNMISQLELFLYGPEGLNLQQYQKDRIAAEIDRWNLVLQVVDAYSFLKKLQSPGHSQLTPEAIQLGKDMMCAVKPLTTYQIAKTLKYITL